MGLEGAGAAAERCVIAAAGVSSASENFCAVAKSLGAGNRSLTIFLGLETPTHSTGLFCHGSSGREVENLVMAGLLSRVFPHPQRFPLEIL